MGTTVAQNEVGLKVNVTRFDEFVVADFNRNFENRFNAGAEIGAGFNATVFGNSFRPLVATYAAYELVQKEKFQFQPTLFLQGHFLKVGKSRVNYSDLNVGYSLFLGQKVKFYNQGLIGYGLNWVENNNSLYLNINFNLGVRYAF